MEAALVYITASNREEAISIARELLSERLIACANIVDHMLSLYWWQGEIDQSHEAILIAKTRVSHVEKITQRVQALHSYNCPCVVGVPIAAGNPAYLDWIEKETGQNA